jgi:hypothetical protein
VELDVVCRTKRGEGAADIARAIQIPEITIHIISKVLQETETNAVNLLNHSKVNNTSQM